MPSVPIRTAVHERVNDLTFVPTETEPAAHSDSYTTFDPAPLFRSIRTYPPLLSTDRQNNSFESQPT